MGNLSNFSSVHVRTAAGSVTGSIVKICGGKTNSGVVHTSEITDFTSGKFNSLIYDDGTTADITGSQNEAVQTATTSFHIAAGSCIDGPFIAIGTDANPLIIYHFGTLTIAND